VGYPPDVDLAFLGAPASPVTIHAREHAWAVALCGEAPGAPWTDVRRYVRCPPCEREIERRLAARSRTGRWK